MNTERRKSIRLIIETLEEASSGLEEVLAEEESYRDNIPENLQGSVVYERADEACDALRTEIDNLNDVIDNLGAAIEEN